MFPPFRYKKSILADAVGVKKYPFRLKGNFEKELACDVRLLLSVQNVIASSPLVAMRHYNTSDFHCQVFLKNNLKAINSL